MLRNLEKHSALVVTKAVSPETFLMVCWAQLPQNPWVTSFCIDNCDSNISKSFVTESLKCLVIFNFLVKFWFSLCWCIQTLGGNHLLLKILTTLNTSYCKLHETPCMLSGWPSSALFNIRTRLRFGVVVYPALGQQVVAGTQSLL